MLIVGLGNPGQKFYGTRHNIGFSVVDCLAEKHRGIWKEEKKIFSLKSEILISGQNVTLLKPQTYMNLSGDAVKNFLKWNLEKEFLKKGEKISFIVVYDDLDFDPGVVKLKYGGSAGGHNGIQDIIAKLSVDAFYRLRIGIGHPRNSSTPMMEVRNWVLEKPKNEDLIKLDDSVKFATNVLELAVTESEEKIRSYISKR